MLYSLVLSLIDTYSFLNVFKYLTVRTGISVFTSMFVVFIIGTPFINFFSAKNAIEPWFFLGFLWCSCGFRGFPEVFLGF